MPIVETKHTRSRLEVIKKDLLKAIRIFSCLSMLLFLSFNIYLLIKNVESVFYLIVYSILICSMVLLFVVDLCIKEGKPLLRNKKTQLKEKKRKAKLIIKIFKYISKVILVGVAIFETFTSDDVVLSDIFNICSAVLLVVQLLFDVVMIYIIKQIDYFRLAFELDVDGSMSIIKKFFPMMTLEEKAILESGGQLHTLNEIKMIESIKESAEEFDQKNKEKEKTLTEIIKANSVQKKSKNPFRILYEKIRNRMSDK